MKSVVITTDIFRCPEFGLQSVVPNVHWLRGLLHNVFSTTDFALTTFSNECDEGSFEVTRYRRAHDLPQEASGWARLVNTRISTDDESYFADLLCAALVVGWGLTPALMELLDRHQIPFVDIEVDPIRFCDDLLLRVRTNSPDLSDYFSCLNVDEAVFSTSVAGLRAFVARIEGATVKPSRPFGLFAGQCLIDLSTVESGHIVTPAERMNEISALAQSVDTLFIKPHPFETDTGHLARLLDAIPNARMTRANIYRILSDINLKHVVALSSSVLDEAAMFGVETTRLIEPDRDASSLIPSSISRWYRVPTEEVTHDGFVNAFLGIASPRSNTPRARLDLRGSLNTRWGVDHLYDQVQLPLRSEPQRKPVPPYRRVARALRSMFGPS
jgi:hypothetical protein